jgi:hypothetical protein
VHVHVGAFVDRDEAVALFGVEPLDRALSHSSLPKLFVDGRVDRHTVSRCP